MLETDCRVLLVQPRFSDASFWNYRASCRLVGAEYPAPPLNLITIAAMLPDSWVVRLVDENIEDLTDGDLAAADLVMLGAMLPQRPGALRVIERAQAAGKPVLIGGPDTTSTPAAYAHANFQFLGEAEGTIEQFIDDWQGGARRGIYDAPKHVADVTRSPVPRYDLLKRKSYIELSLQFSRGCPFLCEFCDIIELFGRNPRTKNVDQVLAELDAIFATGHRGIVDFVDDNLIGNKKAVKAVLPAIVEWQKSHGYPFYFTTEASLNLADDAEFLEMMRDARFMAIFVGIESPDADVLAKTRKKQNTRRDIAENVRRIYGAGIAVVGGFILGFDDEKGSIADDLVALIDDAAIPVAIVGLLFALPGTQLERRLESEGRLYEMDMAALSDDLLDGDQCTLGLNFKTDRPREEIMSDLATVVSKLYAPEAYFQRLRDMVDHLDMSGVNGVASKSGFWVEMRNLSRVLWNVTFKTPWMRGEFWKLIGYTLRRNPAAMNPAISLAVLYAHLAPFSRRVHAEVSQRIVDEANTDGQARWTTTGAEHLQKKLA